MAIRDAAHAHDETLQKEGGIPVQVRNPNAAQVETTNVPFMTSSLRRRAMTSAGTLLIAERVMPEKAEHGRAEDAYLLDLECW